MQTIFIILLIVLGGIYITALFPETSRKTQIAAYKGTMFAHRGYHCIEKGVPENSMAAFRAAVSRGYGIELDLHLTADGEVIVFHDDSLMRMCGLSGSPESMTAAQLQKCRLLKTDERIPAFQEVLTLVDGQVPLLIELKMPGTSTKLCKCVNEILNSYHGPFLIESFNTEALHWFRKHAPHILRGQLSSNLTKSDKTPHWVFRFLTKHLMLNFWGKPDFISYKLSDLPTVNTFLLRKFFAVPFAVWTLRDPVSLKKGMQEYEMQIFENSGELY